MPIQFKKIKNGNIFAKEFENLTQNNTIEFPERQEIAVVYGPNGTGKTSLIKVLEDDENTELEFSFDGKQYNKGSEIFHIINDQNSRNIISGDANDFFVGDDLRRIDELEKTIEEEQSQIIGSVVASLKNDFGISAAKSPLIGLITNPDLKAFIQDCVNNKSKGKNYKGDKLYELISSLKSQNIPNYDQKRIAFVEDDFSNKESIIKKIKELSGVNVDPNPDVKKIEEYKAAIGILEKFPNKKCIVCDAEGIDPAKLLNEKKGHLNGLLGELGDKTKAAIEQIIPMAETDDPFDIKNRLLNSVEKGCSKDIDDLTKEVNDYFQIFAALIENKILRIVNQYKFKEHYDEYKRLIEKGLVLSDEDYLYIEEIISNCISKTLKVETDDNKRIRIFLSDQEFLGKPRNELPLSAGEQNFLSLAFEFLKARNSNCPVIVIDDPISSFDSIYKNKVAYAIVRMLRRKKRIILTHNTDLIRLLDSQFKGCFSLYILNNTNGEVNGFVKLNDEETGMLISLKTLLDAFRTNVPKCVSNHTLFFVSMIPFMRGYANIINDKDVYESLTQVMHGYKTEKVDVAKVYLKLFGNIDAFKNETCVVSASDILKLTTDGINIIDSKKFPLLERTLRHSFTYLYLRLLVERELVKKYSLSLSGNEQLGEIIAEAFPDENDTAQMERRIALTSKKTLINEFNHFEGNLSIFQPAIDITDKALNKEKKDIIDLVNNL